MAEDPMHPYERIVKKSAAGRLKQVATREHRGPAPYHQVNAHTGRDEFIVEYYDNMTGEKYRVVGTQLGWERTIKGLQDAFGKAEVARSKART